MKEKVIGFIGLGAIGFPIACKLISSGLNLRVHSRTRKPHQDQQLCRAKSCTNPRQAAKGVDVLFICVRDDIAVEEVLFGPEGASESLVEGTIVVDLSTISPSKTRLIAEKLALKNISYFDAPVTGGTEGAKNGTLTIFLGCNQKDLERIIPFIQPFTKHIFHFGAVGKGQEVKAINQILVAGSYAAVAEAIALGQALKLPMDTVVEALQKGAASSWALANRSKSMINDEYPLGFKLGLHQKDLFIALKIAQDYGLHLPIASKVKEIEEQLISEGYGNEDVSVLRRAIN